MVEGFHCLSKLTHGLAPSFAVWQSKGSRLEHPDSLVVMFIAPHSRVNPVDT